MTAQHGPRIGSLFTGYGGLDMAAQWVFGGRVTWVSDIAAGPCKILQHHHPDLPNLGDMTRIDWALVEPVDILTGGWPCQPFSMAGLRRTQDDTRALWPEVARAIACLRPGVVVLENVSAIARADAAGRVELARATSSLAELGLDVCWRLTRATEVGAPHQRPRIFLLATDPNRPRLEGRQTIPGPNQLDTGAHGLDPAGRVAPPSWGCPACGGVDPDCATCNIDLRCGHAWGDYWPAIARWAAITGWWPPAARDAAGRLTPRFVEWLQGLEPGWITDTPGITRREAISAAGNGVTPRQAIHALQHMLPGRSRRTQHHEATSGLVESGIEVKADQVRWEWS